MLPKTISELEEQGYGGIDASLETALYEYGLVWTDEECCIDEYHFIFGVGNDGNEYSTFDHGSMSKDDFIELIHESWFELDSVLSFCGLSEQELIDSFPYSIHDCIMYYGIENIFGGSYYQFEIENK